MSEKQLAIKSFKEALRELLEEMEALLASYAEDTVPKKDYIDHINESLEEE